MTLVPDSTPLCTRQETSLLADAVWWRRPLHFEGGRPYARKKTGAPGRAGRCFKTPLFKNAFFLHPNSFFLHKNKHRFFNSMGLLTEISLKSTKITCAIPNIACAIPNFACAIPNDTSRFFCLTNAFFFTFVRTNGCFYKKYVKHPALAPGKVGS